MSKVLEVDWRPDARTLRSFGFIALVGFGLDSIIELLAAGALLWRLSAEAGGAAPETVEARERVVHRFVGITFFALAVYVSVEAGWTLWAHEIPGISGVGIVLALASLTIMPLVSWGKLRAAREIGSAALRAEAKELGAPYDIVRLVAAEGKLPVPNFAAGGIATPADAALMMQLGAEAVFVGSGIFKSSDPPLMAKAIVRATTHYREPEVVAEVSRGLGDAMRGLETAGMAEADLMQHRGW